MISHGESLASIYYIIIFYIEGFKNGSLTCSPNDSSSISIAEYDKEQLFDGLLTSGLDQASCISKVQSHLYCKASPSPHKPSPYLISKLRSYEKLHKRCGINSRDYNINVKKIVHSKNINRAAAASMCKYLVLKPCNGLGNQMITTAATFLYAILTDRVLLIRFDKESMAYSSDQYFVPSLFMNPSFNLEITKMFLYHLGRYLFLPSYEASKLIRRFYETYLAKEDEMIGFQIRVFIPDSVPQQVAMDLVLSCTLKNKLLPKIDTQNSVSSPTRKSGTLKAVLVASLYPENGENLKAMYLNKPTVSGELIEVYQLRHEEHQNFGDNKNSMKAWTEMYLLSLSDVLVATSLSTFGYAAQGLGG
ncbi:hypothetical protein RIF29_33436 [Crotalaria pallida]|uniref:Fucosyltransferase n=1 Tax=Crotalaria pallida TaxID=3830 RepID=A0AAN9EDN8_CROPI